MSTRLEVWGVMLVAAAATAAGCGLLAPFDLGRLSAPSADGGGDGGPEDARVDGDTPWDGDLDGDADRDGPDGDGVATPGPLTVVAKTMIAVTDRVFDLDGDGNADNAMGDLGSPSGDLLALLLSSSMQSAVDDGKRAVLHAPLVSDVATFTDARFVLLYLPALDQDDPPDPADDFSGAEPFAASATSLDACGEPRSCFRDATLVAGRLEARDGILPMPGTLDARGVGAQAEGTVGPEGGEVLFGFGVPCRDMGDERFGLGGDTGLTALETLLSGGRSVGLPDVPGLAPDLDLDGDGLESFALEEDGRIRDCLDGDGVTVIPGRECWRDERMADAISFTLRFGLVPAVFAGRQAGWESEVEGTCDGGPPAESLFDPR